MKLREFRKAVEVADCFQIDVKGQPRSEFTSEQGEADDLKEFYFHWGIKNTLTVTAAEIEAAEYDYSDGSLTFENGNTIYFYHAVAVQLFD